MKTFNINDYERLERVEYGDLNAIIPQKLIAFAGPHDRDIDEDGYPALTPQFYIPIWKKLGVTTIVRLNKKCYDKAVWTNEGFAHYDLYFVDGTTPSLAIVQQFLRICETAKGAIAVHCKAGLGRTGTLIGCYIMKHFAWSAAE
ncbi:dual specificity protein phosphatase CDC14A, partial [Reticulomyxa filosa]